MLLAFFPLSGRSAQLISQILFTSLKKNTTRDLTKTIPAFD